MKTWNKHQLPFIGWATLLMGALLIGCAGEDDFDKGADAMQALAISPQVIDSKNSTASDASLNEAKIDHLDVKLFDKTASAMRLNRCLGNMTSGSQAILDQGNWKDKNNLVDGETYHVLCIANAKEDLQSVQSQSELTSKTQVDADIWKPYHATSNPNKKFLMSSTSDYLMTAAATQNIPASLSRAAAKIIAQLHIEVPGYTAGHPTWSFKNFNTSTTLFSENTSKTLGDMGDTFESANGSNGNYTITTYSYAMHWKDNPEQMPQLIVKVPLTKMDESAEGEGSVGETIDNFYSIPVRDVSQTELKRNFIYTVDAKITNIGSSTEIIYGTPMELKYDVMKWTEGEQTIINADKQNYLLVSPTFHIMRNEKTDNKTIQFYGSDVCTVKIDEVYYYDKDGNKKMITGGSYYPQINLNFANGHTEKKNQGIVNIEAGEFAPLTVKYIKFTITSGDKSQQVTVKQYPLEYAQNIAGWYSSRSKDGWVSPNSIDNKTYQDYPYYNKYYKDYGYTAKEYRNNKIVNLGGENDGTAIDNLTNNRMYVIQITSTIGSDYTIAHAKKETDGSTKDHVVSPAFMIASQLGAVKSGGFDKSTAITHCETYREVAKNADNTLTVYDGWRLPTEEEVDIIIKYQKVDASPIDVVLAGSHYRTLNKTTRKTGYNSNSGSFVRCVRDLTPEEVQKLENQKD